MTTQKNRSSIAKALIATAGTAVFSIAPAFAQQATSFEQLRVLVKPGDTIVVRDDHGQSIKGKIQSLTSTTLEIADKGQIREFTPNGILDISQRRSDSLANGAGAGALAGGLVGTLGVIAGCRESTGCNAGIGAAAIGIYAGLGAGVGVLIDALVTHRQTIYAGPKASVLRRLDMKPIVTKDRKGAAVAFSF